MCSCCHILAVQVGVPINVLVMTIQNVCDLTYTNSSLKIRDFNT